MGIATLPVSYSLLEEMFHLPEGYKIVATHMEDHFVQFLVESQDIHTVPEGSAPPEMTLLVQAVSHPSDPDFKRVIVTPKIGGKPA